MRYLNHVQYEGVRPPTREQRQELEDESELLLDEFKRRVEDASHERFEIPGRARRVIAEYRERGVDLPSFLDLMPDAVRHIEVLRAYGTPDKIQRDIEAFDRMVDLLCYHVPYREVLAVDRQTVRLRQIKREAEWALQQLEEAGFELHHRRDQEGARPLLKTKGGKSRAGNALIRTLYYRLIDAYHKAWPDDLFAGDPKKNPKGLQRHIRDLLVSYFGPRLSRQDVHEAIKNR